MDEQTGRRLEAKLDMVINLLVGTLSGMMALAVLYSGDQVGGIWEERSVLLAAGTFFITAMSLQKMIKY